MREHVLNAALERDGGGGAAAAGARQPHAHHTRALVEGHVKDVAAVLKLK